MKVKIKTVHADRVEPTLSAEVKSKEEVKQEVEKIIDAMFEENNTTVGFYVSLNI